MIELSQTFLDGLAIARYEAVAGVLAGGAVVCYPAPRPAAGGLASGPVIARIPFAPGVGSAGPLGLTLIAPVEGQCAASGDIAWLRIEGGTGAWMMDCDAADMHLDRTAVRAGAFVRLMSGVIR